MMAIDVQSRQGSRVDIYGVIFILSVLMIEFNYLISGINLGNLFVCFSAILLWLNTYFIRGGYVVKPDNLGLLKVAGFYVAFLSFCYLSFFWTSDRLVSFVQATYGLLVFLGACSIARYDFYSVVGWVLKLSACLAVLSLILAVVAPGIAFHEYSSTGYPELRGVLKHQQRLGLNMSVAIGLYFIAWKAGRLNYVLDGAWYRYRYGLLLVLLLCFLGAQARLFAMFFVVSLFVLFLYRSYPRVFLSIFVLGFLLLLTNFSYIEDFLLYYDGEESLTGRTMIWNRVYQVSLDSLYLGHGFAVFDTAPFDYIWSVYRPPHAHNSYLQLFFDLGIFGFFVGIAALFQMVMVMHASQRGMNDYSMGLFLFLLCGAASLTGVIFFGKPSTIMTLMLMFLLMEGKQRMRLV